MKRPIAASSPSTWNKKNQPSDIEEVGGTSASELMEELPSAAAGFLKRQPRVLLVSVAVIAAVGLVWFLSSRD